MWDWLEPEGQVSSRSFDDAEQAAVDAMEQLNLVSMVLNRLSV